MQVELSRTQVIAASAIAFAGACVSHEVVGHGAACLAEGGAIARLSSVYFHCTGGGLVADFGGPAGNVLAGVVCMGALRSRSWTAAVRVGLVLGLAFNILWLAGCLLWSSAAGQSDFALAARLFGPGEVVARVVFAAAGVALALFACRVVVRQGLPRPVVRLAYVAAGSISCASALFYAGPVLPALREAALEGFGAMAWLLFVPRSVSAYTGPAIGETGGRALLPLAILAVLGLFVLGRGYEQVPNPSIERTIVGKPPTAAHVER